MIELKHIVKDYHVGDNTVHALKDVSISFRQNEFVAILGPSGGGKTTLLNIIGGLDRYDSGDLIINGKSTTKYKDRDWDSYRNHAVGFVFQSYNLIPHQTVLANVELALTISGISAKERKERAKKALEDVGLGDQCNKKPSQLSGGQMQRVAIARALVNNPQIVLADEPTGALDSVTSDQIMEILNEVAKDRLVVMVTHNPDLAQQYATRIVRIHDGEITDDSDPYTQTGAVEGFNPGRTGMNILTSFGLSLNNLFTKKARTILTAFAGSIGIIGIALILALSTGVNNYIEDVERDSLSSYPLTITSSSSDITSSMLSLAETLTGGTDVEEGTIVEQQIVNNMFDTLDQNNLAAFKEYVDENMDIIDPLVTTIMYDYGTTLQIYKSDTSDGIVQLNPSSIFSSLTGSSSLMSSLTMTSIFTEMIDDEELVQSQYDVVAGKWPENYDECVLILSDETQISDYILYSLGIRDPEELADAMLDAYRGESVELTGEQMTFDYDYFLNLTFKVVSPADTYEYNEEYEVWEDMSEDEEYMAEVIENSMDLKIVGIVVASTDTASMTQGIGYLSSLTTHMIEVAGESEIVQQQLADTDIDVFSGKTFDELDEEDSTGLDFSEMITIDEDKLASAFGTDIDQNEISEVISTYVNNALSSISVDTTQATNDVTETFTSLATGMFNQYIEDHGVSGIATYTDADVEDMVSDYLDSEDAESVLSSMASSYSLSTDIVKSMYSSLLQATASGYYQLAAGTGMDSAALTSDNVDGLVSTLASSDSMTTALQAIADQLAEAQMKTAVATEMANLSTDLISLIASSFNVDAEVMAEAFEFSMDEDELTRLISSLSSSSSAVTAADNLLDLGYADLEEPTMISFYFENFEDKDTFKEIISEYNSDMTAAGLDENVITYTDITGILMSSITTIINAISYVLIAFVSISLVVSSIMIGIITYISVLERTKEIGILRAMGASKGNISNVFNAETFIIGLFAGLLGVGISALLCIPINAIVHNATGIDEINAVLPTQAAVVLVILSVILTLIGGLIPSRMAAKRDPVVALRSE